MKTTSILSMVISLIYNNQLLKCETFRSYDEFNNEVINIFNNIYDKSTCLIPDKYLHQNYYLDKIKINEDEEQVEYLLDNIIAMLIILVGGGYFLYLLS